MLDLAKHIVNQKAGEFEPENSEDHYEEALTELINAKRQGKTLGRNHGPAARTSWISWTLSRRASQPKPGRNVKSPAKPPRARKKCFCR
jgi:DNA end-binding protein Ku